MGVFFILGAPCSGKGTQSVLQTKLTHISAGDLLRNKYPIGTEVRKILDAGGLVDVDIINGAIKDTIIENNFNVLIDGYPRTIEQAKFIKNYLDSNNVKLGGVLLLEVNDKNTLIERVLKRTFCKTCQNTYNSIDIICCNNILSRRGDDTIEIFNKRYNTFKDNIDNILQILVGPIYHIDSSLSINKIQDLVNVIIN